jgi:hypothetical protein
MSGKHSSSPPSSPAGSAGFSEFVRALSRDWRGALGRFLLALAGASLLWLVVGPAYAWGLAAVARVAAPVLEHSPGMRYEVVGSRVHVVRPFMLANERQPRQLVYIVWAASGNFGPPLLAALVVATPGWGWGARARALGWGLGLLTLTQVAFLLVTFEFWQQMPIRDLRGGLLYLPGHSALGLRIVSPIYYFFEIMGRGFFALLVYFALLLTIGGPGRLASGVLGARGPAPRRRR